MFNESHQHKLGLRQKQRWHLLYFLLAFINIATILLSIWVNQKTVHYLSDSISNSEVWLNRSERYDELAFISSQVNAPGNNVFDTLDVKKEKTNLAKALTEFNSKWQLATMELNEIKDPKVREILLLKLETIKVKTDEMAEEANLIFKYFLKKETQRAGARMATMDRKYNLVNRAFDDLRASARHTKMQYLTNASEKAKDISRFKRYFSTMVLVIILLITWYGYVISKKIAESEKIIQTQGEQLVMSSKLASLGTLSAGLSHEINNPIAIISGIASNLKENISRGTLTIDVLKFKIDQIIKTSERISNIVRGLKSFAHGGKGENYESTNLNEFLDETLRMCAIGLKSKGVELKVNMGETEGYHIICNKTQLSQVFINLLNNSGDSIKGSVSPWVKVETQVKKSELQITVTDSGKGIDKEIQEQIFTPFFTTKEIGKGMGLGLSISLGIIKALGGKIEYNPRSPNTQFILTIPHHIARAGTAPIKKSA